MVFGLPTVFQQAKISVDIAAGISDHLEEGGRANVVGAGAGYKDPARLEQLEGADVQFLVAAEGGGELAAGLGEGWGIENDDVILRTLGGVVAKQIEGIGFNPLDLAMVQSSILVGNFEGGAGAVNTGYRRTVWRKVEGKTSVIAKDVERLAPGIMGGGGVIFTLIEKRSCLLAYQGVVAELDAIHSEDRRALLAFD